MANVVKFVDCDGYCAIYLNGDRILFDDDPNPWVIVELLADVGEYDCERLNVHEAWFYAMGEMPAKFSEVYTDDMDWDMEGEAMDGGEEE